jgi:hypothetical protein
MLVLPCEDWGHYNNCKGDSVTQSEITSGGNLLFSCELWLLTLTKYQPKPRSYSGGVSDKVNEIAALSKM